MERLATKVFIMIMAILTSLFAACRHGEPESVAKSFDRFLYADDLKGVVPKGVTGDDSVRLVHAYIEQWTRQQALLYHAQRNVNINTDRLEKQVEEYRNGLIVYAYEQALVNQKLDTTVADEEIRQYYDSRKDLFRIQRPILKVSYIQLKPDAPELERVKRWFLSADFKDRDLLATYCEAYATDYALRDTSWHYVDALENKIPMDKISADQYGQTGRIFEIVENNELYLIILHDSKRKDTRSPLSLVYDNIHNLILNKRKVALIDQMQKSIVDDARNKNNIEIFN